MSLLLQNQNIDINFKTKDRKTPLIIACEKNKTNVVALLLKHKNIDINTTDKHGQTPFTIACKNNEPKILSLMLEHDCFDLNINIHPEFKHPQEFLSYAYRNYTEEIFHILHKEIFETLDMDEFNFIFKNFSSSDAEESPSPTFDQEDMLKEKSSQFFYHESVFQQRTQ